MGDRGSFFPAGGRNQDRHQFRVERMAADIEGETCGRMIRPGKERTAERLLQAEKEHGSCR